MGVIKPIRDTRMLSPVPSSDFLTGMCSLYEQALGINTDGKSAEEVNLLLKEAAKKPPPPTPNVIPSALSKHFEEGRFTDCTIRVNIKDDDIPVDRPAKRPRSEKDDGTESEGPADGEHGVRVIKAHAVILASRSAYFERAMGGEWRESQDRSLEVEVADETGEASIRHSVIKLCILMSNWYLMISFN
jgi:hypothetical protein